MPERGNDTWNEVVSAGRGVLALVIGDRRAASYFDFSQRGLVGSFIAFLAVMLFNTGVPLLLGVPGMNGLVLRAAATGGLVLALQIAAAALVLRQMRRPDALVPYVVTDNWVTFFLTIVTTALGLMGVGGELLLIATGLVILVVMVNIARLVLTLTLWQIVTFIASQLVAGLVTLLLVGMVFPLSPEQLAEIGATAASSPPS